MSFFPNPTTPFLKTMLPDSGSENLDRPEIFDLRANETNKNDFQNVLRQEIIQGLTKREEVVPGSLPGDRLFTYRKTIPTIVLYDDYGLELYDKLTSVPDYYPFENELNIIKQNGREIALRLSGLNTDSSTALTTNLWGVTGKRAQPAFPVSTDDVNASSPISLSIIELGAGSLKKTSHLLRNVTGLLEGRAMQDAGRRLSRAEYYALDLEYGQLVSTLTALQLETDIGVGPKVGAEVQAKGICGTYTQGLEWISRSLAPPADRDRTTTCRKVILWLGSSIGNFSPSEAVEFLKDQLRPVLDAETRVLIGIDNCRIPEKVQRAYDDSEGVTRQFILNGITAVAHQLGLADGSLSPDHFHYVSRYNVGMRRNEAYLRARQNISITISPLQGLGPEPPSPMVIRFEAGELILIESSYKFSNEEVYQMFDQAGLRVIQSWSDAPELSAGLQPTSWSPTHTLYLVEQPPFKFVHTAPRSLQEDLFSDMRDLRVVHGPPTPKWDFLVKDWDTMNMHLIPLRHFGKNKALSNPLTPPSEVNLQEKVFDFKVSDETNLQCSGGKVPTLEEWITLWKAWDTVTLGMIPTNMLHSKPIDLRHIFLFYLGHIPVFADIHISQHFGEPMSEPARFAKIFERGIDPNMKNPNQCHDHSQVPENEAEWPGLDEVLDFRDAVRKRLRRVYDGLGEAGIGLKQYSRPLGRRLCMIHEHEAMHLETLLYMVVQCSVTNKPPGFTVPDWASLSRAWNMKARLDNARSELVEYSTPQTISVGHDDSEEDDRIKPFSWDHEFGWDNESPSRKAVVGPFKLEGMPITNEDYLNFLLAKQAPHQAIPAQDIPGSWQYSYLPALDAVGGHEMRIKTVYGPVSFHVAQHWPLQASGRQLAQYAKAKGGRLPTANELRVFRMHNPGPGAGQSHIGFQNWHPVPAFPPTKGEDGIWRGGSNGGVWEWSSTLFAAHPQFKPSTAYPGYSQDFFDGEHFVLLGGSWATIPRIAHRQSFVNWYQFDYPYVFAGGRVAYDQ